MSSEVDFASLIKRIGPRVKARFRASCLSSADVDDVIAEVALKLWQNPPKDAVGMFDAYVCKAATHEGARMIRAKLKRGEVTLVENDEVVYVDHTNDDVARESKLLRQLMNLLDNLTAIDRRIILYWANRGYSFEHRTSCPWTEDLSKELKLSEGNLRLRKKRILDSLREAISSEAVAITTE